VIPLTALSVVSMSQPKILEGKKANADADCSCETWAWSGYVDGSVRRHHLHSLRELKNSILKPKAKCRGTKLKHADLLLRRGHLPQRLAAYENIYLVVLPAHLPPEIVPHRHLRGHRA
jgi:hypothetical protein